MLQRTSSSFYDRFEKHWFLIGCFLKLWLLLGLVYTNHAAGIHMFYGIAKKGGDYVEQFGTVDNLIDHGTLSETAEPIPYAGRTPGFIFPYIIYRAFLPAFAAWQVQILVQIALNVFAAWCMYRMIVHYTRRRLFALTGFLIVSALNYSTWLDFEVSPESLCASSYLLGIYFFHRYLIEQKAKLLLFSGAMAGWSFLLRGFTLPYALIFLLVLFWIHIWQQKKIGLFFTRSVVFMFPLILFISIWTTRNYIQLKRFIPLQDAYVPGQDFKNARATKDPAKYSVVQVRKLVSAWGGDCLWTYRGTEMDWMLHMSDKEAASYKFPENIFCPGFTADSLWQLRRLVRLSFTDSVQVNEEMALENRIISSSKNYLAAFRQHHPLLYAVSPVLRVGNFFDKNVVADWPAQKGSAVYYFKAIPLFLYYAVVIVALIGFLWLCFTFQLDALLCLLCGQVLIFFFEFGYLVELSHFRYFATAYLASTFIALYSLGAWMNRKREQAAIAKL